MIKSVQESQTRLVPIFDVYAGTVGWLEGAIVFSGDGCPGAFIRDGFVFAAESGHYLGGFNNGVLRPPDIRSRALPGRAHPPDEASAQPLQPGLGPLRGGCPAQWPWETRL